MTWAAGVALAIVRGGGLSQPAQFRSGGPPELPVLVAGGGHVALEVMVAVGGLPGLRVPVTGHSEAAMMARGTTLRPRQRGGNP